MNIEESIVTLRRLVADEGKTFKRKEDDTILGSDLWLGKYDDITNYIEIDSLPDDQSIIDI